MPYYRIGVDVGGTNTDAAILDVAASDSPDRGVLASHKASTTPDITTGIETAILQVLQISQVKRNLVATVTIGTTHFINALIEANERQLARVAVVRLCGPFTTHVSPFADFPGRLRAILDGGSHFLDGGIEFNGAEIKSIDIEQIRQTARDIVAKGVQAVAIVGVFSPIDHDGTQEETCKKLMLEVAPGLDITISRDIGGVGLIERENATILNASVLRTARRVVNGFKKAVTRLGLSCPLYISRNDGTSVAASEAVNLPITTFASGPTNSMTGAAFLAGYGRQKASSNGAGTTEITCQPDAADLKPQVLVVDIGGTTTDVCALLSSGFPRQAPSFVEVGGVRTAFSMPETHSVGLGGGSIVTTGDGSDMDSMTIGPASVGHYLTQEAKVFGGDKMTASDIVVATGKVELGDPALVRDIPAAFLERARMLMKRMLEGVVDRMRVSAAPVHVLLVGGGAILVTDPLEGVDKIIRPVHQGAANAVGAAIAEIAGDVDTIEIPNGRDEKEIVAAACQKAIAAAIKRGAAAGEVRVADVTKTPLQYVNNGAMRIQVRAVGRLDTAPALSLTNGHADAAPDDNLDVESIAEDRPSAIANGNELRDHQAEAVDYQTYRPDVRKAVWYISETDVDFISTGCGVLGTGGGGPTHYEALVCRDLLRGGSKGRMRVISPNALDDDDLIGFGSYYGAPSVMNERIVSGCEIETGIEALLKLLGGKKLNAFLTDEIGGGNGLSAFPTAVRYDVPVVDGDCMGRAYPTMYHATTSVYGHSLTPCALSDGRGNVSVLMNADSAFRVEKLLRPAAVELGLGCGVCANPLSGDAVKRHAVPQTISLAWYIGRAVHKAREEKMNFVDAISQVCNVTLLFSGKVIDVQRKIQDGYTMGSVLIAPQQDQSAEKEGGMQMMIPFQNEYLYAVKTDPAAQSQGEIVCTVPELISILGQDGEAIGSQDLRFGLHVSVIALPAHELWKTAQGLKVGGPKAFGLDIPYVSIGMQTMNASVIDEFAS